MNFKIEWVNHAGYILSFNGTNLLVDPWLSKSAFNNGWDLVSPTVVSDASLKSIDYIWFSHEHPDHFSVPDLLGSLKKNCLNATVIFQKTKDKRVKNFCEKNGFKFVELGSDQILKLSDQFSIRVLPHGLIDSLSIVQAGDRVIINTNDCVLTPDDCSQIRKVAPKCDLLLTQFSYASWMGNANQPEVRREAVCEKWNEIEIQVNAFSPTHVIPFASFIYFSHEENRYMNDEVASIRSVSGKIERELKRNCIVLYPGEVWEFTESHAESNKKNNEGSLIKYENDFNVKREFIKDSVVECDILFQSSSEYMKRIRHKNGFLCNYFFYKAGCFIRFVFKRESIGIAGTKIYLRDLDKSFSFDIHNGLREISTGKAEVDAELGSQSLNFALLNEFGFSSLQVNGRFQVSSETGYLRFRRAFSLGLLNSVGETLLKNRIDMLLENRTKGKRLSYVHLHDKEPSYIS